MKCICIVCKKSNESAKCVITEPLGMFPFMCPYIHGKETDWKEVKNAKRKNARRVSSTRTASGVKA